MANSTRTRKSRFLFDFSPLRESMRTLDITCLVQASSESTLYTTLDRAKEAMTGLVEITGPYSSTRAFYGALVQGDANPFVMTVLNGWATVVFKFVCAMPFAVATTPDTISFGSTASARAMARRWRWPPENSCG